MARRKKSQTKGKSADVVASKQQAEEDMIFLKRAKELLVEGNVHLKSVRLEHAKQAYSKALQLCKGHTDKEAVLLREVHNNLGTILMLQHNYEEGVKEFTLALEYEPMLVSARQRRASANEKAGNLLAALADVRWLMRVLPQHSEMLVNHHNRLMAQLRGKTQVHRQAEERRLSELANGDAKVVKLKFVCDGDTRAAETTSSVNYAELRALALTKFDGVTFFTIKYVDGGGDSVTVSSREDVRLAMADFEGRGAEPKFQIVSVEERQVIQPPADELASVAVPSGLDDMMQQPLPNSGGNANGGKDGSANLKTKKEDEIYELDDWMIDFAELFKDQLGACAMGHQPPNPPVAVTHLSPSLSILTRHPLFLFTLLCWPLFCSLTPPHTHPTIYCTPPTGIDPDAPLDLSREAWDKCAEALDASIHHAQSEKLLRQAAEKFEDSILTGLVNLGNVYMCIARKYVDAKGEIEGDGEGKEKGEGKGVGKGEGEGKGEGKGEDVKAAAACIEKADAEIRAAHKIYVQALDRNGDFSDAILALGQLEFEKGKISMSAHMPMGHPYHISHAKAYFDKAISFFVSTLEKLEAAEKSADPLGKGKREGQGGGG